MLIYIEARMATRCLRFIRAHFILYLPTPCFFFRDEGFTIAAAVAIQRIHHCSSSSSLFLPHPDKFDTPPPPHDSA